MTAAGVAAACQLTHARAGAAFLSGMSAQPLLALGMARHIVVVDSTVHGGKQSHGVSSEMEPAMGQPTAPARELKEIFDLSCHPQAQDYAALEMLNRLDHDVREYRATYSGETVHLSGMLPEDIAKCIVEAKYDRLHRCASFSMALQQLDTLSAQLSALEENDELMMSAGLDAAINLVNSEPSAKCALGELTHALRRLAGDELRLNYVQIAEQLLSTCAEADLLRINPHLAIDNRLAKLLSVVAETALRTSRLAYIAQCRVQARAILAQVRSLRFRAPELEPWALDQECRDLQAQSAALASALSVRRHTLHPRRRSSTELVLRDTAACTLDYTYDPRFILTEFGASIFLRRGQVQLVNE